MLTAEERARIDALRRLVASDHASIDRDESLSPAGRQEQHAHVRQAGDKMHADILAAADQREQQAYNRAYSRLWGQRPGTSETEALQLADRANAISNPVQAQAEMRDALAAGRSRYAAALAHKCRSMLTSPDGQHWDDALRTYAASSPQINRDLGTVAQHDAGPPPSEIFYRAPLAHPPASAMQGA